MTYTEKMTELRGLLDSVNRRIEQQQRASAASFAKYGRAARRFGGWAPSRALLLERERLENEIKNVEYAG